MDRRRVLRPSSAPSHVSLMRDRPPSKPPACAGWFRRNHMPAQDGSAGTTGPPNQVRCWFRRNHPRRPPGESPQCRQPARTAQVSAKYPLPGQRMVLRQHTGAASARWVAMGHVGKISPLLTRRAPRGVPAKNRLWGAWHVTCRNSRLPLLVVSAERACRQNVPFLDRHTRGSTTAGHAPSAYRQEISGRPGC